MFITIITETINNLIKKYKNLKKNNNLYLKINFNQLNL